jgi:hypothetical protein
MRDVCSKFARGISGGRLSKMSILENNCMQSTASAAGYSTGTALATMFGALLILSATPENPNPKTWDTQPILVVAAFIMCCACLGVFLAIPLKRQLINREQLRFPSGIAAAATLRSLYSAGTEAVRKAYALVSSIFIGALIGLLNTTHGSLGVIDRLFAWSRRPSVQHPTARTLARTWLRCVDAMGHLSHRFGDPRWASNRAASSSPPACYGFESPFVAARIRLLTSSSRACDSTDIANAGVEVMFARSI